MFFMPSGLRIALSPITSGKYVGVLHTKEERLEPYMWTEQGIDSKCEGF